jgi:hypothetical protein
VINVGNGSHICNFISNCRHLITYHLTQQVNNGGKEIFLYDSWVGYKPPVEYPDLIPHIAKLMRLYGNAIQNYVKKGNNGMYEWINFENFMVSEKKKPNLKRSCRKERYA